MSTKPPQSQKNRITNVYVVMVRVGKRKKTQEESDELDKTDVDKSTNSNGRQILEGKQADEHGILIGM